MSTTEHQEGGVEAVENLQSEFDARLKAAMKAGDSRTRDLIRMIKSRITERITAPGASHEVTDALVLDVIKVYVKQMKKAAVEYGKAGESGRERAEHLLFEVAYLEPFLPQKLDEAATRALVETLIADQGIGSGQIGRLMGAVMKEHRDSVDAGLVKRIAQELLS